MQAYWTLTRRELGAYFISLAGYVIIAVSVFQMGLSFVILLEKLRSESTLMPITELFYITPFFWCILLLSAPLITMRLFALEKYSGTFETLMTAPVGDLQVVLAKFTAALVFHMLMWLPLLGCVFVVQHYSSAPGVVDYGTIGSTFFGILLLGSLFMSLGAFASALTRSQIVAAVLALAFGLSLFFLGFLAEQVPNPQGGWMLDALNYIAMIDHMKDFSRGVVDTRHVVFYLTGTVFFLFLTYRVVESRRWK